MSGERGNSHTNLEIGRALEQARAELGLSLWQVEEATKIRVRYLRDLERENFEVLPAVYVLGSLKTYADYLGLDGEAMVRELKTRQAPQPEAPDPKPEEGKQSRRGGFLAALLGGLTATGGQEAAVDPAQTTVPRSGSRLYLGFGAVLILVLAVALGAVFGDAGHPAVSQLSEPVTSQAPSRIAFSGEAQDAKSAGDRLAEQAESPDEGGGEDTREVEKDRGEKKDQDENAGTRPEDTGDVAVTLPASITASASASAAATSIPAASASASASSAATASAASTTASPAPAATVPASTAPADDAQGSPVAEPTVAEPVTDQPEPVAAHGASAGPLRVVRAEEVQPGERIVRKVRIVRSFVRVR